MTYQDVIQEWLHYHNHRGPNWSAADLLRLLIQFLDLTPGGHGATPDRFRLYLGEQAMIPDTSLCDWPAEMIGAQIRALVQRGN